MLGSSSRLASLRVGAGFSLALAAPPAFAEAQGAPEPPPDSGGAVESAPPAGPAPNEIVPPRLVGEAIATYPEGASGDATVVLVVTVGVDGSVESALATETQPPFSEQAEAAARTFRFTPATRGGRPMRAKIKLELQFREPVPVATDALEPPADGAAPPARALGTPGAAEATELVEPEDPTEVLVTGLRAEPSRTATLSRAEVREIPGTFGDPFRAIEIMPGVTPIVSGLPFFFIRGAPPGNVGYYLDGVRVPLLFHVGAGPSVVHPALMDRVDLYSGGYPAKFGRFAGGIVSGEALPPSTEFHGEYNLRIFDVGGVAEVPFDEGRGSVLVGGRYSYTALVLSELSPDTSLAYWDYQARASYQVTPDDRLSVFSFGSYDFVGQRAESRTITLFGTQFHRVDLRYDHALGSRGHVRTALTLGIDSSRVQAQDRSVRDRMASARSEVTYRVSDAVLVRGGTDVGFDNYDVVVGSNDLSPTAARVADFFPSRTDIALGAWADTVIAVDRRFEIVPGLRTDLYGSNGNAAVAVDPRFGLRLAVTPALSLIAAFGLAHQPPSFVVPLPGFQPGGLAGGLQKALQESAGIELDLGSATTLTATVFQNAFFDMSDPLGSSEPLPAGCAPGQYPTDSIGGDRGDQPDEPSYCGPRFDQGTLGPDRSGGGGQAADSRGGRRAGEAFEVRTMGSAYGLELMLKRQLTGKLGGFLSYTLSRSTRSYENREYIASFDRTHVLNVALAYDLGRRWRAGARTMFYSGLPKIPDPTDPDSTRLPAFFRLDVRVEKRWQLGERAFLAAVAEWMNATLSKEAVTTTCRLDGCEAQMIGPVSIPSIGIEGGF
jgi:hypothetical protein